MKILVTGGSGFLGKSVIGALYNSCFKYDDVFICRKKDFDLTNNDDVKRLYSTYQPNAVIHLAAEVGGIGANMANPGRFFYANMSMGINMVENARIFNLFLLVQFVRIQNFVRLLFLKNLYGTDIQKKLMLLME